jgi:hypothetical protein
MDKWKRKLDITITLVILTAILLLSDPLKCRAQWLGVTIAEQPSVTTMLEMPVGFARLSLITHVNQVDPQFRVRFGVAYDKIPGLEFIGYVPQMNLSLKYPGYNTPFGAEVRWHLDSDTYRLVLGTDIYTGAPVFSPYFTAFAKFK